MSISVKPDMPDTIDLNSRWLGIENLIYSDFCLSKAILFPRFGKFLVIFKNY